MKFFVCCLALFFSSNVAVLAAEPVKISINVKDQTASEVGKLLAEKSGELIIVDPKIEKRVNVGITNLELPRILDMISTSVEATWKKVQFAQKTDDKVDMELLKSSILALASFPMLAVSVEDKDGKSTSLCAKGVTSGEMPAIKLPEDYKMVTAYVVYAPEKPADKTASAETEDSSEKTEKMIKDAFNMPVDMATMSSEERQKIFQNEMMGYMTLAPEARQQVLKDQISSVFNMSPEIRQKYMQDMREAFRGMDIPGMRNRQPGEGGRNRER